ncbi:hypothetical protein O181_130932 [Austropuccinia psidii MF-1]|uniref:Uncharacterized protein n=1 Tax=Austropuccinia psidii MF-1 TaxID=1389203 RepID=A0A9Q3QCX2_9BASI|nr:hypothetical protein [Austropuccinia psidii MF-1]
MDLDQDIPVINQKRQECQPRGEAQMEDARTSTSSQRLASTFDTLIESPESDITALAVVIPESLSTGNNRYIPVSVQELVYGIKTARVVTFPKSLDRHHELLSSSEEVHGPKNTEELLKGLTPMSCKGQVQQIKAWLKKPKHVIRGPKGEVGSREGKQPSGSSPSLNKQKSASKVPKNSQQTLKTNQKGNQKAKEKAKPKWKNPYLQNYRIPKKEKTAMNNVFNMARTLREFKNKEEERLNQSFPKK